MRILLVSDLHLDTAFGWAGPALGDVLRANLRATLDRFATLARHSRVDALVCGGDLFDQADLTGLGGHLDGLVLRQGRYVIGHDLDALARERTVRRGRARRRSAPGAARGRRDAPRGP